MPKGIYKSTRRHGLHKSRFWYIYRSILSRTKYNKGLFPLYVGKKCYWNTFLDFRDDMYESYLIHVEEFGEKQTTIDRIDNKGNYSKENCRWATYREQANNTKRNINITYNGTTLSIAEWARKLNIPRARIMKRYFYNWPVDEMLGFKERPLDSRSGKNSPSWKGGISSNMKEYGHLWRLYHK
jgi:hypothetical protein